MAKYYITLTTKTGVIDLKYPILARDEEHAYEQAAAIYPEAAGIVVYKK